MGLQRIISYELIKHSRKMSISLVPAWGCKSWLLTRLAMFCTQDLFVAMFCTRFIFQDIGWTKFIHFIIIRYSKNIGPYILFFPKKYFICNKKFQIQLRRGDCPPLPLTGVAPACFLFYFKEKYLTLFPYTILLFLFTFSVMS